MTESRRGVLFAVAAYFFWGIFPLYWPLLKPAGAFEILSHRVAWSLVVVLALLGRRIGNLRALAARQVRLLVVATCLIGFNWALYIWAVNQARVVEVALGYFINPLVNVLLGVVVFRDRLRRLQWIAVGFALVAVVVLTANYGTLPWVSLALAASFALYGLTKKTAAVAAVESLAVETGILFVPAVLYLVYLEHQGIGVLGHPPLGRSLLLACAGPATAIPLLFFGAAAIRIPLSTLGLVQYIAPTLQFLCGVVVFHEAMPSSRWIGFAFVWVALGIFSVDAIRASR